MTTILGYVGVLGFSAAGGFVRALVLSIRDGAL